MSQDTASTEQKADTGPLTLPPAILGEQPARRLPIWMWGVGGVAVALVIGAVIYLTRPADPMSDPRPVEIARGFVAAIEAKDASKMLSFVVPTDMGGEKIKLLLTGPACLSKTAPGHAELAAFYKAASEKGMIFGDARAVKAQPGNARGMSVFYREMTSRGVPLAQEMSITFEGTGPMAGMMSKMGGTTMTTEAVSMATDPIPDSMFEIPAGYRVNKR